jgi:protease PrsW
MTIYQFPVLVLLGFIPSFIWLLFYLQKDKRPEPNQIVILVFLLGMLITLPAAGIEKFLSELLEKNFTISLANYTLIYFLVIVGITEEVLKYLTARFSALKTVEFDEPIDAMIYMIIAGLGFAAIENILVVFSLKTPFLLEHTILALLGRFVGATLLHALTAANIGFFISLSLFRTKYRKLLVLVGILSSAILHGIYNIGITMEGWLIILVAGTVLISLFILVLYEFQEIKKLISICKVKLLK